MSTALQIASLGSGSNGNATIVDDGETCLLIDLGFSVKETEKRLRRIGKVPQDIDAILVTHEHADHIHGVAPFARKYHPPVYITPGSHNPQKMGLMPKVHHVNIHRKFTIGSLEVEPVPVPHDSAEPCQYLVTANEIKIGLLTDLGHVTPFVVQQYRCCEILLLECNHDLAMLANGPYPYKLKQRVGGNQGHLNNEQAAGLLKSMQLDRLEHLVLMHISEKNNKSSLAVDAVKQVLYGWTGKMHIADQSAGFDWITCKLKK
ncbi:MAG: MBL fold metallo-hydrolase [Pseudomonadales bacterium]|nr:MBL fold metallo-hydrolase [Pseudomonadales bacterium]